jgi:hypothetical protein
MYKIVFSGLWRPMKTCNMLYRIPPPPPSLQNAGETNVFERDFLDIGNECFTRSYKPERWKLDSTDIIYPFVTFRLVFCSSKDMKQAKGNCSSSSHKESLKISIYRSWKPAKIWNHKKLGLFKICQPFL